MRDDPSDAALRARLAHLAAARDGTLLRVDRGDYEIVLLNEGRELQLYFAAPSAHGMQLSGVMSRINLGAPLKLLGLYTQAMLLALLWAPAPTRVYAAGLGGGRVPLVLHQLLPETMIDATEIDPAVAEIAQTHFALAPDARLRVHIEDGADFLETRRADAPYDIILIDCYGGGATIPDKFASEAFYALCKARLAPGGVVAANIDPQDHALREKLAIFARAFPQAMRFKSGPANVLFGAEAPPDLTRLNALAQHFAAAAPLKALAAKLTPLA